MLSLTPLSEEVVAEDELHETKDEDGVGYLGAAKGFIGNVLSNFTPLADESIPIPQIVAEMEMEEMERNKDNTTFLEGAGNAFQLLGDTLNYFMSNLQGEVVEGDVEVIVTSEDIKTIAEEVRKSGGVTNMAARNIINQTKDNVDKKEPSTSESTPIKKDNIFEGKENFLTKTVQKRQNSEPIYSRSESEVAHLGCSIVEWDNMSKRWFNHGSLKKDNQEHLRTSLELLEEELGVISDKKSGFEGKEEKETHVRRRFRENLLKHPKKSYACLLMSFDKDGESDSVNNNNEQGAVPSEKETYLVTVQYEGKLGETEDRVVRAVPLQRSNLI